MIYSALTAGKALTGQIYPVTTFGAFTVSLIFIYNLYLGDYLYKNYENLLHMGIIKSIKLAILVSIVRTVQQLKAPTEHVA
jgi:hypothetical protein